jgi:hypothetical protein
MQPRQRQTDRSRTPSITFIFSSFPYSFFFLLISTFTMGNTFFGSSTTTSTASEVTNALKDPSYQHSWASIEKKIHDVDPLLTESLRQQNDARLLQQIQSVSKLPNAFWELLKDNNNITISGSYPFAVAHDLLKEKAWQGADIDIFVSLSLDHECSQPLDTLQKKFQRGKHISMLIWKALGMDVDVLAPEAKEAKDMKEKMFIGASNIVYANGDLKRTFVCSSKLKHPITRRTINVIVLDLKDEYTNIQDAISKTFDVKVLATCVNQNSIFIPHRKNLVAKCSTFQPGIRAKERKAKYEARGLQFV